MRFNRKSWALASAIVLAVIGIVIGLRAADLKELDSVFQSEEEKAAKFKKEQVQSVLRRAAAFGPIPDPLTEMLGDTKIKSVKIARLRQEFNLHWWDVKLLEKVSCATLVIDSDLLQEIRNILVAGNIKSPKPTPFREVPYLPDLALYVEMESGLTTTILFQWREDFHPRPANGWINGKFISGDFSLPENIAIWMDKAGGDWGKTCLGQRVRDFIQDRDKLTKEN